MGNHVAEVVEELPLVRTIKVHGGMCSELWNLVARISKIFPEIEAARPRCSSGIDALCLLNNGITKAKSLLQCCTESSALYLALTGEAILSRCKKSRNILEQSLSQIQSMVPVMLAAKISGIIADLRSASFCLDPKEEEAGRVLRELLHKYGSTIDSTEECALKAIHNVSSRLHISSQKAILIEKRSIRKLLDKFGQTEPNKKKILLFFLNLLNKYGKKMTEENGLFDHEGSFPHPIQFNLYSEMELRLDHKPNEARIDILSRPVPPEEFICPLSLRLMHDPVVIASGQSYERMWIQKWFDEGNKTCPKTNMKLAHFSFTSNTGMKDLIEKWCSKNRVSIPDPKLQEALLVKSCEYSSNSIASLSSSMNDLNLPIDFSNVSFGSSQGSDVKRSCEIDMEFVSKFSTLPWDSKCNAVEDVKRLLKDRDYECWSVIPSEKFVQMLLRFLKDARDLHDGQAQMTGCLLLLEFVQKYRNSVSYLKEHEYDLLASLLDTEVSKQALSILEAISFHQNCANNISSGALTSILNILDSQVPELLEPALKILSNLSLKEDIISFIIRSNIIPKITPFLDSNTLSGYCATIFKNLCENGEGRMLIIKTEGSIGLIVKLLEKDDRVEQEIAVSILLSLCSQKAEFCELVMDEGVIPGLVSVSVNGNNRARAMAMELLRILKDESHSNGETPLEAEVVSNNVDSSKQRIDKNSPKSKGLFGKLFSAKKKK